MPDKPPSRETPIDRVDPDRFKSKVVIGASCWEWAGTLNPKGYGVLHLTAKRTDMAHRIAYRLWRGEIADGLTIDHLCRNRRCVNPFHLEVVTNRINVLRGVGPTAQNARKTACIRGHELTPRGYAPWERRCRTCQAAAVRRHDAKRRRKGYVRQGAQ